MDEVRERLPKPEKKPNILLRFLIFLLTVALILGAIALVVFRDKVNFDTLKRYFVYRSLEKSDTGQTQSFPYDSGGKGGFSRLGDDLLVWSASGARIYSAGGVAYVNDALSLPSPAAAVAGDVAVVYSAGGNHLRLYKGREQVLALEAETGKEFLSAQVTSSGQLVTVTRETGSGYKAMVTVYTDKGAPLLSPRISSQFVMDAFLTQDGQALGVVTVGQEEGIFRSRLTLYEAKAETEEPFATLSLGNSAILRGKTTQNQFWLLGDAALMVVDADGTMAGSYDYGGQYLKDYTLDGDGYAVLLLGKYRAGSDATLLTIDSAGSILASQPLSTQVLELVAAENYVGILTAGALDLYTQDLKPFASLPEPAGLQGVVLRADGTAFLLESETASLYIP